MAGAPGGGRRTLAELLSSHGVVPAKAFGQHFLAEPSLAERISRLAEIGPGSRVVEVGAGTGALTGALASSGAQVTAIELDRALLPILRSQCEHLGVRIVAGDALRISWPELLGEGVDWDLVANLPYNIATPLVLTMLETVPAVRRMLVMVQAEVAQRLVAGPGDSARGAVSVRVEAMAEARIVARVAPDVFLPRPKVASALLRIRRLTEPPADMAGVPREVLRLLLDTAFVGRRKMLRRSLGNLVTPEGFALAAVDPTARPQELDLAAWGRLGRWRATSDRPQPS